MGSELSVVSGVDVFIRVVNIAAKTAWTMATKESEWQHYKGSGLRTIPSYKTIRYQVGDDKPMACKENEASLQYVKVSSKSEASINEGNEGLLQYKDKLLNMCSEMQRRYE